MRVVPEVLRWAMDGAGWNAEELAERTGIDARRISAWRSRPSSVEMRSLKKISACVKVPVLALCLTSPPDGGMADLGARPKRAGGRLSRETLGAARRARFVQFGARDLLEARRGGAGPVAVRASLRDDPAAAGRRAAARLGLRGAGAPYGALRAAVESAGAFALQLPMDPAEARVVTLASKPPAVIAVSSKEGRRARALALLHGYAHAMLGSDCICAPGPGGGGPREERWCAAAAAAALGRDGAGRAPAARGPPRPQAPPGQFGRTAVAHFNAYGARYVRLVCESRETGLITLSGMARYLDVGMDQLEELEAMV